jgi:hypothetical protein
MPLPDRLSRPFPSLLASELRIVGLALGREGLLAAGALAAAAFLTAATAIRYGERLDVVPEMLLVALPVSLFVPRFVWKGDPPFGRAVLWNLPVRRHHAALARIVAGALWLMLALLIAFLLLIATALATGGGIGIAELRAVGPFATGLGAAASVPWTTPAWMWLVPFGAALLFYVASSAVIVGFRHPVRWLAAASVAMVLLGVLAIFLGRHNPLQQGLDHMLETLIGGRYGLDFALTGGVTSLSREIDVPGPGSVNLWSALPQAGRWASALALWLGGALIALALALRRHWEG